MGVLAVFAAGACVCSFAHAQPAPIEASSAQPAGPSAGQSPELVLPKAVQSLEVKEHLGAVLPLELEFQNAEGKKVSLGDYFPAGTGKVKAGELPKPAIILIAYYQCQIVCSVVKDKFVECMDQMDMTAGKDFNFLVFSFDPRDNVPSANGAKNHSLAGYKRSGKPEVDAGFGFHAGEVEGTRQLANALGFPYRKVENGEFAHPVALFVVSPQGKICRYIYGYKYDPIQVKLALLDATEGKLAKSLGDYFMNYCYMYDSATGKYTIQAMQVMKIGGVLVLIGVGVLVGGLRLSEYFKMRSRQRPGAGLAMPANRLDQSVTRPVA